MPTATDWWSRQAGLAPDRPTQTTGLDPSNLSYGFGGAAPGSGMPMFGQGGTPAPMFGGMPMGTQTNLPPPPAMPAPPPSMPQAPIGGMFGGSGLTQPPAPAQDTPQRDQIAQALMQQNQQGYGSY